MEISIKDRIKEYFGNLSAKDEYLIAGLYLDENNEKELRETALEHYNASSAEKVNLQHILDRIHFHINMSRTKHSVSQKILLAYYRVAAVLMVPLLVAGIYLMVQDRYADVAYSEICAPRGARIQFTLPDGSKGFLNGGSTLQYPVNFVVNRNVNLVGEGYFEVVKDPKHPFVVQTKYADVRVFGTKFDVCAYESDKEVFTILDEGSVSVFNKAQNTYSTLSPGEQNIINTNTGDMKNVQVDTKFYTSWKEEMLRFNNSSFNEVVTKMERWYGVRIMLDGSLRYSENYTFTVRTESLKEVLQLLSLTTPMDFKVENDTVTIYPINKK